MTGIRRMTSPPRTCSEAGSEACDSARPIGLRSRTRTGSSPGSVRARLDPWGAVSVRPGPSFPASPPTVGQSRVPLLFCLFAAGEQQTRPGLIHGANFVIHKAGGETLSPHDFLSEVGRNSGRPGFSRPFMSSAICFCPHSGGSGARVDISRRLFYTYPHVASCVKRIP